MITYNKLYKEFSSEKNLLLAFKKARKGKSKKFYVIQFERELVNNLESLRIELINESYYPEVHKKFIVRDPKTRIIHSSNFRDRIVHHAIVNVLEPIYQKIFIYDSFASQKNKGTHEGVKRFEKFVRKVSNGKLIKNPFNNNSIKGYCLKADVRKYFDSMNHEVLIKILRRKIADEKLINLINKVLKNFSEEIGLPLGNYTSQFFANVYLNELDYFVKQDLKVKYYIRYVDDFVILDKNKERLEFYMKEIIKFLETIKLKLHPDKSKILCLRNGLNFLGYRVFYHYRLLRTRNIKHFKKKLENNRILLENKEITKEQFNCRVQGWLGYARYANTFNLIKKLNILHLSNDKKDLNRGLG